MSRAFALPFAFLLIAAAEGGPLPHAAGAPAGPGPGCGGGYVAARGDTLYSIARRCETTVTELVQENRLGRPPVLESGQRLAIPGFARDEESKPPEPQDGVEVPVIRPHVRPRIDQQPPRGARPDRPRPPLAPPLPPDVRMPPAPHQTGDIYHFQQGDTLYSLARWARTTVPALRAANPDVDPTDIEVGDPIRLPRGAARPEPLRLRERGRPAPRPAVAPPPPPASAPLPPRPRLSPLLTNRPPAVRPPPPPEAGKPPAGDEDDDAVTPGGMDDGGPEPDGM